MRYLLICSFCFLKLNLNAQVKIPVTGGVLYQYNTILPHSSDIANLSDSNPFALAVELTKTDTSLKAWNTCNCYSKTGLGVNFINFNNPEILGNAYNLYFITEPYLTRGNTIFLSFKTRMGLSYLTKVYHPDDNPKNLFFSSPLSFILGLGVKLNYYVSDHWIRNAGIYYNHISNGGIKEPNKGMNYPGFGIGIDYQLNPVKLSKRNREGISRDRGLVGNLKIIGTVNTVGADSIFEETRKSLIGLYGNVLKPVSNINGISLGLEVYRDEAIREVIERDKGDEDFHFAAILLGHNFLFGNFVFNQQFAFYIYKPYPVTHLLSYQRYELYYVMNGNWSLGFSLKAHGHIAEFFDFRIGYVF